jgi:hypothetical protein
MHSQARRVCVSDRTGLDSDLVERSKPAPRESKSLCNTTLDTTLAKHGSHSLLLLLLLVMLVVAVPLLLT